MPRGRSPGQQTASKASKSSRAELELVTCTCRQVKSPVCWTATRVGLSNCFLPSLHGTGSSCATSYFWLLLIWCLISSPQPGSHFNPICPLSRICVYLCKYTYECVEKISFPIVSLEKAISILLCFAEKKARPKCPNFIRGGLYKLGLWVLWKIMHPNFSVV